MEPSQNTVVMNELFYQNLEVIYQSLYLPRLTDYLVSLITSYVEAYQEVLITSMASGNDNPELNPLLKALSGPIEEITNPNNPRLSDGNTYPAVELIKGKLNELDSSMGKDFKRALAKPNTPPLIDSSLGFNNVKFILIGCLLLGVLLFVMYFSLK